MNGLTSKKIVMKQNVVTARTEIVNRQNSSLKIVRKGLRGISEK